MKDSKLTYSQTGVNYNVLDPFKKLAQKKGEETAGNLSNFQASEVEEIRGESAYVWEEEDCYRALVIEGLGTKNLVADEMEKATGKTYYSQIAQDTVAAIVNDILTVGALPQVVGAYFGTGGADWFKNENRSKALVEGWTKACNLAECVWGGGETPGLSGIIDPETIDLAGACTGIIKPKDRFTSGAKLTPGDAILLIESSGIHANGLSLARSIADKLPERYLTQLPDGKSYGEALLIPSYIYVKVIKALFEKGIDIHYMVNITGHGWRKLMRANKEFTYFISEVTPSPVIFDFIKKHSSGSDEEMYATFNMGAGFAVYLPADQVQKAQDAIKDAGFQSWNAGVIKEGPKKVVIEPKNIIFEAETLEVR